MNDYHLGAIIIAIAVGVSTTAAYGWMALGAFLICSGLLNHFSKDKSDG